MRVQVAGGTCTAVLPERQDHLRTSSILCPNLSGGVSGLYFSKAPGSNPLDVGPLDWLFPRSGWRSVIFTELEEQGRRLAVVPHDIVPGWRRIWGEWQPQTEAAAMQWQTPIYSDYEVAAELRRPDELAGILLLDRDGEEGWVFLIDPNKRRGAWWRWQDGRPVEPMIGIPYQKPLLAQVQVLLRRLLRAHQGALLLLLAAWLLLQLGRRLQRLRPRLSLSKPESWPVTPRHYGTAVLIIAFLLFAAAAAIAGDVLERIPHVQDSITYLFQAQLLARGRFWAAAPTMPEFFEQEFMSVYNGRWFGQYQPGFPLILAAGIRLGQPWLVNPILSALTILLLYLLGKNLFSRGTGLLAALLALFSPFILFMSGSLMAHPAELFWVTSFMLCWTLALRRDQRRWPLLAGLSLGMILLTRQAAAAAAALPFLLIMAVGELLEKRQWRPLLKKTSLLLAAALPLAILLLFYQNKLTGDPFRDPRQIARPFDRIGFGLDVGETPNAFRLEWNEGGQVVDWIFDPQQPPRGHTLARGIYNTVQNWRALERELFGWPPIFTLAFLWLAFLAAKPAKADFALLAVIAATILVYILYWSDGMMYGPRYYYAALPALLLLTARGIQAAALWLGRGGQSAAALLAALLIAGSLLFHLPARIDSHRGYNFISAQERAQVANAVSPPAIVFIEEDPLNWWEYGRFFSANTPWLDGPIIYARDLGSTQNAKLRAQYPGRQAYIRRADGQLVSYE